MLASINNGPCLSLHAKAAAAGLYTSTMFCRSSIVAIAAFLEAFQKVADAATSSKGRQHIL